jgi:hypothetical protein
MYVEKKFSWILRRRPRPKLGCGANERRRRREEMESQNTLNSMLVSIPRSNLLLSSL